MIITIFVYIIIVKSIDRECFNISDFTADDGLLDGGYTYYSFNDTSLVYSHFVYKHNYIWKLRIDDNQTEITVEKQTNKTFQNQFELVEKSYKIAFSYVTGNTDNYDTHFCAFNTEYFECFVRIVFHQSITRREVLD